MGGNWDALMTSFFHNSHNANSNTDTNALCKMVTASGTRNELISFTVAHRNRSRLHLLFTRWQYGLIGRNSSLNGNLFALEGELILERCHIMDIDLGVFSLPIPIAIVSTASVIYDALARDPDPNTMAGLYAAGDPNIE